MLIEIAIVTDVDGDTLWVQTRRQSTCGACSARKACGHGMLDSLRDGQAHRLQAFAADGELFKAGDVVRLELPESVLLRASLLTYLFPLLMMLSATLFAGGALQLPTFWVVLAAFVGLGAGFLILRRFAAGARRSYTPVAYHSEQDAPAVVTVSGG